MTSNNFLLLNLNHIGDILFTTPTIRALKERFPDSRITVVIRAGMEDLLRYNPFVDEIIPLQRGGWQTIKLISQVRALRCKTSILYTFSSMRMSLVGRLSGASVRIGFDEPELVRFLNHPVRREPGKHRVEWYLDLVRVVGADLSNPKMEMFVGEDERLYAKDLLRSNGITGDRPIIAINPGASVPGNRWFAERYAALCDKLGAEGVDVILIGSKGDRPIIDRVLQASKGNLTDLSGKTSIGQLAAVLEQCSLEVSNDTGPLHLAVSVGTPVVAIFGPADPRITGPHDPCSLVLWERQACFPCRCKKDCERECLSAITVDMVFDGVMKLTASRIAK